MTGLPFVTCSVCQTEQPLEVLLGTDDARGVVDLLARMPGTPGLRKAALRYVGLFAPTSQRLRWGRVEKLLAELVTMMETARVERNGRTWAAPLDAWQAAFEVVLANANLRRPLKSHGYLLEVIVGNADKAEGKAEERTEQQRQGAAGTGGGARRAEPSEPAGMPAHIKAQLKDFTKGARNG